MPYQAPKQVPTSSGLPETEQYYDRTTPSLNVFATPLSFPIDDSALMTINFNTKNQLQNWQNFVSSLGTFKTLTDRIRAENERKRYTEGMLASAQGLNLPEHAAKAYTEGYYNYQANLDFQTYSTSLQLFAAENMGTWETQEEVEQALDQFTNQFLEARPINDTYLNALLPSILEQNSAIINSWTQQKVAQVQEDIINTTIAGIQKTADDVLETGLQEFLGVSSLEVLANDPKFLETGITNPDIHGLLREGLTQAQKDAEAMGFSKADASEIYVHRVGTLAVKYGMPELLDFTSIPDKTGIALDQTVLSEAIDTYRIQASQVKQQKLAAIAELQETQYQEYLDGFYKSIFSQISSLMYLSETDPVLAREEALSLRNELFTEDSPLWDLSQTNFREVVDTLNTLVYNPRDFASVSDDTVYIDLKTQAYNDELSIDELNVALRDGSLSKKDYLELLDVVYEAEAEKEANRKAYFENLLVNEGRLYGVDPADLDTILYDKNITPSTKDAITSTYLQQQAERVRTEEELAKAQEEAAKAQKAEAQQMLYIDYLTRISTGQLEPSESLIQEIQKQVVDGNLSPTKGETLINKVNQLIEDADKAKVNSIYGPYANPLLEKTAKSTIKGITSDPIMGTINTAFEGILERAWLDLDYQFRLNHGTNPENAYELYQKEVIQPLEDFGLKQYQEYFGDYIPSYYRSKQQTSQVPQNTQTIQPTPSTTTQRRSTSNVQPDVMTGAAPTVPTPSTTTQRRAISNVQPDVMTGAAPTVPTPRTNIAQPQAQQQSTTSVTRPVTPVPVPQQIVDDAVSKAILNNNIQTSVTMLRDQLIIEGYPEDEAKALIMESAINQARQFVINNGSTMDTQIQLQIRLLGLGFTFAESNYIIRQVGFR